ncbi:MAG: endopeptidase La [SAR324 cluster bacterium]|nr:endopeptidase La [SAR324 cluster bacterium]
MNDQNKDNLEDDIESIDDIEVLKDKLTDDVSTSTAIVKAKHTLPKRTGLVVITHRPLFPNMIVPLVIEGELFVKTIKTALNNKPSYLGVTLGKDDFNLKKISINNIFTIGTIARIVRVFNLTDKSAQILLDVTSRIQIKKITKTKKGLIADITPIEEEEKIKLTDSIRAYSREIINNLKELIRLNPLIKEELNQFISQVNIEDPQRLADFAATLTSASRFDVQKILEEENSQKRLGKTLLLVKKELTLSRLQAKISQQIEEKISSNQRKFFLKEQLKEIRKELGLSKDEKSQEIEKFKSRAKKFKWGNDVDEVFKEELNKLNLLDPQSPEFNVSRNYLDWITSLPWGIYKKENLDLAKAKKILEKDHFGLEDVKESILDMIAAMSLHKNVSGRILCLVGPPGVGKTSIGKSIARALGRPFFRFSLGGMRDEAEIKGHRRTYIGAMPGKFIQALKTTKKSNPVIMLDEIDKVSKNYIGDPSSALLEVLDKEQNSSFLDHYLDLPFDLSKVFFICTANQLDSIPEALKNRMDVIRLPGYIATEKLAIAKRYLVKKQKIENGLRLKKISFSDKSLLKIIEDYAREAGVRNLEKMIAKICRSLARKIVEKKIKLPLMITSHMIPQYLQSPIFTKDDIIGENVSGCVNGLAWTNYGGAILSIEATDMTSNQKGFKQTGQLGKVMVESSEIAYSYVMANAKKFSVDVEKYTSRLVHLHVPAGATPKDGPSAGIAMALSLISLMKKEAIRTKIGLTGEISLTGAVLPIGGLKEKVVAAQRSGIKEIVMPKQNKRDFDEIPKLIKKGIKFHFVDHFDEVLKICLPSLKRKI